MDNLDIDERQAPLGEDIVWGAQGIADELRIPVTRARWLIRSHKIPVTRLPGGRQLFTTRKALRKAFKATTAA
jgi:hypothetical protein